MVVRPGPPRLYAHRGAAVELPENTLPSFRLALDLGADALETDAHLTRDGHVVLSHDPTGRRMCGIPTPIADATLDEVRSWDAGVGLVDAKRRAAAREEGLPHPDPRRSAGRAPGRPVQRRREVAPPRDGRPDARGRESSEGVRAHPPRQLRRGDPPRSSARQGYAGKTGLAQADVLRLLAFPRRALSLRWLRLQGAAAQLPYRIYGIDLGTRAVVDKCHALGLEVHYWTVNEPALATRLLVAGADAIMTDDPRSVGPAVKSFRAT